MDKRLFPSIKGPAVTVTSTAITIIIAALITSIITSIFFFTAGGNLMTTPTYAQQTKDPRLLNLQGLYQQVKKDFEAIGMALVFYRADYQKVPRVQTIIHVKHELQPDFIKSMPVTDPWGNPYLYDYDAFRDDKYTLRCTGLDGLTGHGLTDDDLVYENKAFTHVPNLPPPMSAAVKPAIKNDYSTTMNEIRTIGMALDAYSIDNGFYPLVNSVTELIPHLTPRYTSHIPGIDPWGNLYLYKSAGTAGYLLGSPGSDSAFDGFHQIAYYNNPKGHDIIFKNGQFTLSPVPK